MHTVWKYQIPIRDVFPVDIPENARFLCLASEPQRAMWWEIPDTEAVKQHHVFWLVGTGHEVPYNDLVYRGTIFSGSLVFHLYESTSVLEWSNALIA